MPPLEQTVGASMNDNFGAGKSAINANGSWMIGSYTGYDGLELGIAPTPVGPSGKRASMFNGLADSIFAGTDNKEAAGKWVAFLGSEECQKIVGQAGVVFPAIPAAVDEAKKAFETKGVDVTAFTAAGRRRHDVPLPDHRQRRRRQRHHGARDGCRDRRQGAGELAHRGQRAGQRPVQVSRISGPT